MLIDSILMFIFNFVIAKFFGIWPKMHFYLYGDKIQLPITHLFFGQITQDLAVGYIRVVSASMHCVKSLLVVFLPIWPKRQFYSFFLHLTDYSTN